MVSNHSNRGLMLVAAGLALLVAGFATGQDAKEKDRDARAKAAIAMTAPAAVKSTVAPMPREKAGKLCTDATCTCPPGTKGPASTQIGKALSEHRVVVIFYGGTPAKCCGGVLVGVDEDVPPGVSERLPIVVYAPAGSGAITPIASLARVATNEEITAAIRKAQAASR